MRTKKHITPSRVSFKTIIRDTVTGQIIAVWFSLNERPDRERREVSQDIGAVLRKEAN